MQTDGRFVAASVLRRSLAGFRDAVAVMAQRRSPAQVSPGRASRMEQEIEQVGERFWTDQIRFRL